MDEINPFYIEFDMFLADCGY